MHLQRNHSTSLLVFHTLVCVAPDRMLVIAEAYWLGLCVKIIVDILVHDPAIALS